MSNMFDQTRQKWGDSAYVIWVFTVGAVLLLIGIVLFVEDMMSSLQGIQQLEAVYNIDPVNMEITYYAIALSAQVAQVAFMFLFLIDTRKNRWALGVVAFFFIIDLVSDIQDRSGSWLFSTNGIHLDARTGVATMMSLVFFTIGSELFISTGLGLALALYKPFRKQLKILFARDRTGQQGQPKNQPPVSSSPGRNKGNQRPAQPVLPAYPDAGMPRPGRNSEIEWVMEP